MVAPVAASLATLTAHIGARADAAKWFAPYAGFLFVSACALAGAAVSAGCATLLANAGKRWMATAAVLVAVAVLGSRYAPWLGYGAPAVALVVGPLVVSGRVHAVPARWSDARAAALCLAAQASCLGVGIWLPFCQSAPALLLPVMLVPATIAVYICAEHLALESRWRAAVAGLPLLALPLVGLARNPTLVPTAVALGGAAIAFAVLRAFPGACSRATRWARRHAVAFAVPALVLVLVLPWSFRDAANADLGGHEGQHLGWINSISFGKLMMADAGFTYGPAREYALALLAWSLGGLTLEHVRLAHVVANLCGMLCLFAAIHRVSARQIHVVLLGIILLVTHSSLVTFLVYTSTYAFGWADAARAGLATLSVVLALTRNPRDARASQRSLIAAGALAAFATLYSHDFGLPAVCATLLGLASEVLIRGRARAWARARSSLRNVMLYTSGIVAVVAPVLAYHALRGKLGSLFDGYRWSVAVSSGAAPWGGAPWKTEHASFLTYSAFTSPTGSQPFVPDRVLDYVVPPAIAVLGLAHTLVAIIRRTFVQRTALVAALAAMSTVTLRHPFLQADAWHMANAATPALVLLMTLVAGGGRVLLRGRGPLVLAGTLAAAMAPLLWMMGSGFGAVNARLARIATGDERPSFGPVYAYDDLPRAGDVRIGSEHLNSVRYVRAHSKPSDPVLAMTWALGGGTEAFLAQRRNPTSFDKPDEIVTARARARMLAELKREPPLLVIGNFGDYLGDDSRAYLAEGWQTLEGGGSVRTRKR
jgi:hypothetical protein